MAMKSDVVFMLENAGWLAMLVDNGGTIIRSNQAAIKVFGHVLESGAPKLSAIWTPENGITPEQFMAQWERSPTSTAQLRFYIKGGSASRFSVSVCSFNKDGQRFFVFQLLPEFVTEAPSNTEFTQAHKQKLDCALQLARTVSLDFNNALTSILGHTSLLLSQMESNHPWRNSLMEVEKSASRAAEIANDLGTFSRQEKEPRSQSTASLNAILQRTVELFPNSESQTINWTLQLEKRLFTAKFDEAKMQQAFVKILENAVQALDPNGTITVMSRNIELTEPAQDRDLRLAAGTYVCGEIADNGCGIADDILPRIFEPFFTTKKTGKHRGLGLALVYGIVTNHGGGVAVSSQPGTGTSVRVYVPAEKKIVRDSGVNSKELNGTQTILMVDDEDLLLTMGETILSAYGYRVLTANSGQKALDILSKRDTPVDLVITDMVMPAMSGRELAEHIQRLAPGTRILCTSGFVRPSKEDEVSDQTYLQKPFTSRDLLIKVKGMLAEH
jgi:two-component system, cell cycle sensor histidine kinase and response regulator CckA